MSFTLNIYHAMWWLHRTATAMKWTHTPQPTKSQARDIRQKLSSNSPVDSYLFGIKQQNYNVITTTPKYVLVAWKWSIKPTVQKDYEASAERVVLLLSREISQRKCLSVIGQNTLHRGISG